MLIFGLIGRIQAIRFLWVWKPRFVIDSIFGIFGLSGIRCTEKIDFFQKAFTSEKLAGDLCRGSKSGSVEENEVDSRELSIWLAFSSLFLVSRFRQRGKINNCFILIVLNMKASDWDLDLSNQARGWHHEFDYRDVSKLPSIFLLNSPHQVKSCLLTPSCESSSW